MNIYDVNKKSIKQISNKELLLIHYRIHQLHGAYKNKQSPKIDELKKFLKKIHKIVIDEMDSRHLKHDSVIMRLFKNANFKEKL